jgi:hypothetical protein
VLGTVVCPLSDVLHGGGEGCLATCPNIRPSSEGGGRLLGASRGAAPPPSPSGADSQPWRPGIGQCHHFQGRSGAFPSGGARCGVRHRLRPLGDTQRTSVASASAVGHKAPPLRGGPSGRGSGVL